MLFRLPRERPAIEVTEPGFDGKTVVVKESFKLSGEQHSQSKLMPGYLLVGFVENPVRARTYLNRTVVPPL